MRSAREELDRALLEMASRLERPRCGDAEDTHLWVSEKAVDRALAASHCRGCPIFALCLDAAIEEGEAFHVRGGRDFRATPIKKSKKKDAA